VPVRKLIAAVTTPLAVGIPYALLIGWWARVYPPRGWILLGLEMAGSALIFLLLAWIAIFTSAERAEWIGRMRLLLRPIARSIAPAVLSRGETS